MDKKDRPMISLITATFNSGKTLEKTIQSVINQSYKDFEYIIIDNVSQDDTIKIIQKYENHISSFISEPDRGIYEAWNKGVQRAMGEWIAFLGSDDVLYPDALEKYALCLSQNPDINFISSRIVLYWGEKKIRTIGEKWDWKKFQHKMNIAHVGALHHKSLFETYGLFNPSFRIVGDYEFLLRVGKNLKPGFLPDTTVEMQIGGASWLNKKTLQECRKAKIANKIKKRIADIDYYIALLRMCVKKTLIFFGYLK